MVESENASAFFIASDQQNRNLGMMLHEINSCLTEKEKSSAPMMGRSFLRCPISFRLN